MKWIYFLLLPVFLFAKTPCEAQKSQSSKFKAFETNATVEIKKVSKNPKVKCRWVCDKKVYKEQKISQALEFYKNSKDYKFGYSSISK